MKKPAEGTPAGLNVSRSRFRILGFSRLTILSH